MTPYTKNFLTFLSNLNVTFIIPSWQRSYEWDLEQCSVFLEDILDTARQKTEHFFGVITYFVDDSDEGAGIFSAPKKLVLIDGQQRITTAMLFLSAFRDLNEDDAERQSINEQYLLNSRTAGDKKYRIKLKQAEADREAFDAIISSSHVSSGLFQTRLYQNYAFFFRELRRLKENGENIDDLIKFGLMKFNIIAVELHPEKNPWENPQDIFESMNSLGKPLSFADLVRNFLLLGAPGSSEELYQRYWLPIERKLSSKASDFLRDYMQMKEASFFPKASDANAKLLYAAFKRCFKEKKAEDILKDLACYSDLYGAVTGVSHSGNSGIDKALSDIRFSGSGTASSFSMFLLNEWKEGRLTASETEEVLNALFIFLMRRRICGLSSAENKIMPSLSKYIGYIERAKDKTRAMFDVLSAHESSFRLPNDTEVAKNLSSMNFYNFRYNKFIFALLEEAITKNRPDITDRTLTIEHIMPQKLNADWEEMLGFEKRETHEAYVHNIGNLTLIRHNSELGNRSFEEKKKIYEENAGLQIARMCITDQNVWNADAIDKRAWKLTKLILENVLPVPDERRYINNFSSKETHGLSFIDLGLIGRTVQFSKDRSISAVVTGDKTVRFEGREWKLSPLTRELMERRGECSRSGSYQGAAYWEYDGEKLSDIMERNIMT